MPLVCENKKKCGNKRAPALHPNGCCNLCYPKSKEGKEIAKQVKQRKVDAENLRIKEWRAGK